MHIFIYKKGCVCNECLISRHSHYRLKSKCVCVHFIFTLFSKSTDRQTDNFAGFFGQPALIVCGFLTRTCSAVLIVILAPPPLRANPREAGGL